MQKIAPVNLPYSVKTLWFDPADIEVKPNDRVVVKTARGLEMGVVCGDVFEVDYEEVKSLKSPLRPIERIATEEDVERAEEMDRLGREAMPVFKRLARETNEDMHPVSVEYMLDGDKAIFYFESEERIDFRELVRKLAAEFHIRIDMRQIGVRDEARIVGGIAHCGQEVCCRRLGGEFKPVSIRMAKDQDLSLNPQKISGLCGRLMCCLRYESQEYKEFKAKAPKVDAVVQTPDGEGRVVEHDVPRESISVRVGEDKPVSVPLSAFTLEGDDRKRAKVDPEAWDRAVEEAQLAIYDSIDLLHIPTFTGEDKLGDARAVHHEQSPKPSRKKRHGSDAGHASDEDGRRRPRRRGGSGSGDMEEQTQKRTPRRRSTKIKADGSFAEKVVEGDPQSSGASAEKTQKGHAKQTPRKRQGKPGKPASSNERQKDQQPSKQGEPKKKSVRPGHKSSGLAHGDGGQKPHDSEAHKGEKSEGAPRRRRRRRRPSGQKGDSGSAPSSSGGAE